MCLSLLRLRYDKKKKINSRHVDFYSRGLVGIQSSVVVISSTNRAGAHHGSKALPGNNKYCSILTKYTHFRFLIFYHSILFMNNSISIWFLKFSACPIDCLQ